MPTARELKVKQPDRVRRGAPVTVSYLPVTRRVKRVERKEAEVVIRDIPQAVRFVEMRPKDVHPWDWHQLYTTDEELWDAIAEEATDAVESGELQRYDRLR